MLLRMLIVEGSGANAEVLVHTLHRRGYDVQVELVETEAAMRMALDKGQWDIILAEDTLPGFSASDTLKIAYEKGIYIPLIIISRTLADKPRKTVMTLGMVDVSHHNRLSDLGSTAYYSPTHAEQLQAFADQVVIVLESANRDDEPRRPAPEPQQRSPQLQQAKDGTETIFNASGDGISLIDPDGTIRHANPAFVQMFGLSGDIRGKFLQMFIKLSDHKKCDDALLEVSQQRQPIRVELTCLRADGVVFEVDAALSLVPTDQADGARILCSLRDISQQKQLEADLREALAREKELNELNSRFVSTVSHEFRTPLATILVSSELVKAYGDRLTLEKNIEHLDRIGVQVQRLTELIDDMLTIGRADSRAAFNPVRLDLNNFCRMVIEELQPTAPTHHIQLITNEACTPVDIDPKLMRHVLYNLLSNAVKYSPQGGVVTLELACHPYVAVMRVTDQGIGIPEADLKRLFEAFHRATNVGLIQGTGLGLVFVKRAVEAHGGSIRVESEVGKGTTVIVTLPT